MAQTDSSMSWACKLTNFGPFHILSALAVVDNNKSQIYFILFLDTLAVIGPNRPNSKTHVKLFSYIRAALSMH